MLVNVEMLPVPPAVPANEYPLIKPVPPAVPAIVLIPVTLPLPPETPVTLNVVIAPDPSMLSTVIIKSLPGLAASKFVPSTRNSSVPA